MEINKILALLLVAVMSSANCISLAAERNHEPAYDLEKYTQAVEFLESIAPNSVFDKEPGREITKIEFLYELAMIYNSNFADMVGEEGVRFEDIPVGHPNEKLVAFALNMGWIDSSKSFGAENYITFQEASKMMVSSLGYGDYSKLTGGYPYGYIAVANSLRLYKNTRYTNSDTLMYYDCIMMLNNMMFAAPLSYAGQSGTDVFLKTGGKTFLEVQYKILQFNEIVTANDISGLTSIEGAVDQDRLQIGEVLFEYHKDSNKDMDYLGHAVRAYYRDGTQTESGNHEIVFIEDRSDVSTISADKLVSYSDFRLFYNSSETSTNSLNLSRGLYFLYNGKAHQPDDMDFIPDSGSVTLIDNNNDGNYDVVKATHYSYMTVDVVSETFMRITSTKGEQFLDLDIDQSVYEIYKLENEQVKPGFISEIKSGDMIAYASSIDRLYTKIYFPLKNIKGVISAIGDEFIYIDDKEYKITEHLRKYYANNMVIGGISTIYLSPNGEVAGIANESVQSSAYPFGYLVGIAYKEIEETEVKLFTATGKMEIVNIAPKLLINGMTCDSGSLEAMKWTPLYTDALPSDTDYPGKVFVPQLIRYRTNAKNSICEIITATLAEDYISAGTTPVEGFNYNLANDKKLIRFHDSGEAGYMFRSLSSIFENRFNIGTATIFVIPKNAVDKQKDDLYRIGSAASFTADNRHEVASYNVDYRGMPEVIVYMDKESTAVSPLSSDGVVMRKVSALDDQGNLCTRLYIYNGTQVVHVNILDNIAVDGIDASGMSMSIGVEQINVGDYLRYVVDGNSNATALSVDFDVKNERWRQPVGNNTYHYGMVYSISGNYIYISPKIDGQVEYDFRFDRLKHFMTTGRYAVCDLKTGSIVPANFEDIVPYISVGNQDEASKMFLKARFDDPRGFCVIYK